MKTINMDRAYPLALYFNMDRTLKKHTQKMTGPSWTGPSTLYFACARANMPFGTGH
jgi:hypothetical protein